MEIKLDSHCHTLASCHAYSTILENAKAASDAGLELLAITDHAPCMDDAPHLVHFLNYGCLDKSLFGVEMLYGVEADMIDFNGNVSMAQSVLETMDIGIVSWHTVVFSAGSKAENTRAYLQAMQRRGVTIIGHPEDARIPVDFDALAKEAKKTGVLIELNNASQKRGNLRQNAKENATLLLEACQKHGTKIVLGSDAHFANSVGDMGLAMALVEETAFPHELIINGDVAGFRAIVEQRK